MREVELPSEKVRADDSDSDSDSERRRRPRMRRSRMTRALQQSKLPLGGKLPNRPVKSDQRLTSSENRWCISKVKIRALELQGKKLSSVRIGIKKSVLLKRKADIVKIDSLYRSSRRIVVILSYFPGGFIFLGNHDIWS